MDLIKLLQSVEELIYDVALWLGFTPKTLVRVLTRPKWMYAYVAEEFDKEPAERYSSYLSPILFWVFVAVVPYALFFRAIASGNKTFESWSVEHFIILVSVLLIGAPVVFSFLIKSARNEVIDRSGLKRVFYSQCLCFAPFQLANLPYLVVLTFHLQSRMVRTATLGFSYLFLLWFIIAEVHICKQELETGWIRTLVLVLIFTLLVILISTFSKSLWMFIDILLRN